MNLLETFPGLSFCPHLPTDRQAAFLLSSVAHGDAPAPVELLFGGAAGGGKSDAMLMAALMFVDRPGYSAIVFRRTFADLSLPGAIMDRAHEWLTGSPAVWNETRKTYTFPSGATIAFGYLDHPRDEYRYQGAEFQTICFDELTQFEEQPYVYLFSRLRRLLDAGIPVRMLAASNPGGVGHHWVHRRFIEKPGPMAYFIPSKLRDNPYLDEAQYTASLMHLPETLRRQYLEGDWDAAEGMAFPEFREDVHVVPEFPIPAEWERYEQMDHGVSHPAVFALVVVDYDGNLIVADSYYSPGLISYHAAQVLERRQGWYSPWTGPDGREHRHEPHTIADPSVRNSTGTETRWGEPATIATEYLDQSNGQIVLVPGNNDPRAGRTRISELLREDPDRYFPDWHPKYGQKGSPRLFVVGSKNPELVTQLKGAPLLPIDSGRRNAGEIVDPRWEGEHGHAVAALRYGVMSRPDASQRVEQEDEDPRRRWLREVERREREGFNQHGPPLQSV